MANYPYIIASFPDLLLDFEQHPLDVAATVAEVKGQLSEKDGKLVDWLEFGLEGSHLTPHFYRGVQETRSSTGSTSTGNCDWPKSPTSKACR